MKRTLTVILLLATLTFSTFAQTNSNIDATVKQTTATNINQVMIEMLSGVKSAGSEIYGASKEAIHKSVDFISKQAPDVIHQFLLWKFLESLVPAVFKLVVICVLVKAILWFLKVRNATDSGETKFFSWVAAMICVISSLCILNNMGKDITIMAKIRLAPKVYIIEYVVDTIKEQTQPKFHGHASINNTGYKDCN